MKKKYTPAKIRVFLVLTENSLANGSNQQFLITPNSNAIEVEDWQEGNGYEQHDFEI